MFSFEVIMSCMIESSMSKTWPLLQAGVRKSNSSFCLCAPDSSAAQDALAKERGFLAMSHQDTDAKLLFSTPLVAVCGCLVCKRGSGATQKPGVGGPRWVGGLRWCQGLCFASRGCALIPLGHTTICCDKRQRAGEHSLCCRNSNSVCWCVVVLFLHQARLSSSAGNHFSLCVLFRDGTCLFFPWIGC